MSNRTTYIHLLLCTLSFKHFVQHAQFRKLGNVSKTFSSFGHVTRLERKYLMDYKNYDTDMEYMIMK